jgi:hypothetical protein
MYTDHDIYNPVYVLCSSKKNKAKSIVLRPALVYSSGHATVSTQSGIALSDICTNQLEQKQQWSTHSQHSYSWFTVSK